MSTPKLVELRSNLRPAEDAIESAIAGGRPEELAAIGGWLGRVGTLLSMRVAGLGRDAVRRDLVEEDEVLGVEDVARRLKQKPSWVYAHAPGLPFRLNIPGRLKFSRKGLDNYLRNRRAG